MALFRWCQEPELYLKHLNEPVALIDALPYLLELILLHISEKRHLYKVCICLRCQSRGRGLRGIEADIEVATCSMLEIFQAILRLREMSLEIFPERLEDCLG